MPTPNTTKPFDNDDGKEEKGKRKREREREKGTRQRGARSRWLGQQHPGGVWRATNDHEPDGGRRENAKPSASTLAVALKGTEEKKTTECLARARATMV